MDRSKIAFILYSLLICVVIVSACREDARKSALPPGKVEVLGPFEPSEETTYGAERESVFRYHDENAKPRPGTIEAVAILFESVQGSGYEHSARAYHAIDDNDNYRIVLWPMGANQHDLEGGNYPRVLGNNVRVLPTKNLCLPGVELCDDCEENCALNAFTKYGIQAYDRPLAHTLVPCSTAVAWMTKYKRQHPAPGYLLGFGIHPNIIQEMTRVSNAAGFRAYHGKDHYGVTFPVFLPMESSGKSMRKGARWQTHISDCPQNCEVMNSIDRPE